MQRATTDKRTYKELYAQQELMDDFSYIFTVDYSLKLREFVIQPVFRHISHIASATFVIVAYLIFKQLVYWLLYLYVSFVALYR